MDSPGACHASVKVHGNTERSVGPRCSEQSPWYPLLRCWMPKLQAHCGTGQDASVELSQVHTQTAQAGAGTHQPRVLWVRQPQAGAGALGREGRGSGVSSPTSHTPHPHTPKNRNCFQHPLPRRLAKCPAAIGSSKKCLWNDHLGCGGMSK